VAPALVLHHPVKFQRVLKRAPRSALAALGTPHTPSTLSTLSQLSQPTQHTLMLTCLNDS
jgi:hypothetical protein